MRLTAGSVMLGASVVAVVVAVVGGLLVLGSPGEERMRGLDRRRVADLKGIAAATDLYWTRHARLPATLDELNAEPGVAIGMRDPATSEAYVYQPVDSVRYDLCATFDREAEATSRRPAENLWAHGSGRHCLQLEAERIERNDAGEAPDTATRTPR